MPDTQWPLFVVFEQERPGKPHTHAGSVHAPDSEMALMNARDVFVRRPECVSLWVAPADQVLSVTAEALEQNPQLQHSNPGAPEPVERQRYLVFRKIGSKGVLTLAGRVTAERPVAAMQKAVQRYADPRATLWWVLPERLVSRTDPRDRAILFEPARRKVFRHQSNFRTLTMMREMLRRAEGHADPED